MTAYRESAKPPRRAPAIRWRVVFARVVLGLLAGVALGLLGWVQWWAWTTTDPEAYGFASVVRVFFTVPTVLAASMVAVYWAGVAGKWLLDTARGPWRVRQ